MSSDVSIASIDLADGLDGSEASEESLESVAGVEAKGRGSEAEREYQRGYYEVNRDRILSYKRQYRASNLDRVRSQERYRRLHSLEERRAYFAQRRSLQSANKKWQTYLLRCPSGRVVYVGMSRQFSRRLSDHAIKHQWFNDVDQAKTTLHTWPNQAFAMVAEAAMILRYKPAFNVVGSEREKTYWVYSYFDSSGKSLYVGRTSNLRKRRNAHSVDASWWPLVDHSRTEINYAGSDATSQLMEAIRIWGLSPKYNIQGRTRLRKASA